jgi:hypothetical protein
MENKLEKIVRDEYIMIKLTSEEKQAIAKAARFVGMTVSGYARFRLIEATKEDLKEEK